MTVFGWFKNIRRSSLAELSNSIHDKFVRRGQANLKAAVAFASTNLLCDAIPEAKIVEIAKALHNGPIPYSTEDLALSTALNFFQQKELKSLLQDVQLEARMQILEWLDDGKVNPILALAFEKTLYERFKVPH